MRMLLVARRRRRGSHLETCSTVDTDLLAFWVALGRAYAREFNFLDAWGKIMEAGMQLVRDIEDAEDAGEDLVLDGM